jgi:hypothetical protein
MSTIKCEFCESEITKYNLIKHKKSESCSKIHKLLLKKEEEYKKYLDEKDIILNKFQNNNKQLEDKIQLLSQENFNLKSEIKALEKSSEGYRKIVEKVATKSTSKEIDNFNENIFQIDIKLDNKQLNKTKYKDVSEDIIKKENHSLKLKDNYQLEYRDNDGFINITNLSKAGGKKFNDWNI